MKDVRETKPLMYTAIEKSIQTYLTEFAQQVQESGENIGMDDIMEEMVGMIEFTERLHLNVIMSTIGTSVSNAKDMRKIPEFEGEAIALVKATRNLLKGCREDFNRNLDARLKSTLVALDVEAIWESGLTHNEQVAKEIMEKLRSEEGADDASKSAQKED